MSRDILRKKSLAIHISCALLPVSVFAADLEISESEKVSAIWSFNSPTYSPASTIKTNDGNIIVKGGLNIDISDISSQLAKYIIYTQGPGIDLGMGSIITTNNSANIINAEGGGAVSGKDLAIIGLDSGYDGVMAKMFGINTIAPAENTGGKFIDLSGKTQLTLNNFTGDVVGISANCNATAECHAGQASNIQLEDLGLNVSSNNNATGIEANNQTISMNASSIVVDSEGVNASISGLVANNGIIRASDYTDLTVSGNGALNAVSASGSLANIDLQGGTAITLYRYQNSLYGANGIVADDGARINLSDSWLTLYADSHVDDTDRFLTAQNSSADTASRIVVNGAFKAAVDSTAEKPSSIIYVGAEGNSTIDFEGDVTLGDLRNADNATAFLARESGQITMTDRKVTAWGNIISDNGAIRLRSSDNSYLYSTISTANNGTVDLSLNGTGTLWDMTGNSTLSNLELNNGKINFLNDSGTAFKTLTVEGNYSGNGGTLVMNVTLNADNDSPADRMIVKGDTSGSTIIHFNNIYGHGAHTDRGIELITVAGSSEGQFSTDRRIGIGLYDYALVQKDKNWYLSNNVEDVGTGTDVTDPPASETQTDDNSNGNGNSDTPGDSVNGSDEQAVNGGNESNSASEAPTPGNTADEPVRENVSGGETNNGNGSAGGNAIAGRSDYARVYRPESGSYIANIAAANTLFSTRLHDRQGEHDYIDAVTGERHSTTMWMRHSGTHHRFEEAGGQLISRSNSYTVQLGGDVARWSTTDTDSLRLGVMAGYGNNKSKTRSEITNYTSRGEVKGYSAGLYATWFANDATRTGAWVDSWILYNWFDNDVSGHQMRAESYKSRGVTASLEAGYSLPVGASEKFSYWLEPRGQVVMMNVKADSLKEEQGTRVSSTGDGNVMSQLGVRAWMKGNTENGMPDAFRPYIETNWVHNTRAFGVTMNGENNTMIGSKNSVEARVGAEGQITGQLALWANVGHKVGHHKYSETGGSLGIKYQF